MAAQRAAGPPAAPVRPHESSDTLVVLRHDWMSHRLRIEESSGQSSRPAGPLVHFSWGTRRHGGRRLIIARSWMQGELVGCASTLTATEEAIHLLAGLGALLSTWAASVGRKASLPSDSANLSWPCFPA